MSKDTQALDRLRGLTDDDTEAVTVPEDSEVAPKRVPVKSKKATTARKPATTRKPATRAKKAPATERAADEEE